MIDILDESSLAYQLRHFKTDNSNKCLSSMLLVISFVVSSSTPN